MIQGFKKWKYLQDFNPGLFGILVNPFYIARKGLYHEISRFAPFIKGSVIDVGCGRKPYRDLFHCEEYIGLDIENPGHSHENEDVDVFYDGKTFPFESGRFDNALCNQVLEHVFNPDEFLLEINKVLKTGGHLLLTVPFAWDEHEQPHDYARYSSFGLRHLLEKNGFEVIELVKSVNDARALAQLWNAFIYKKTVSDSGLMNLVACMVLMAPFTLLSSVLCPLLGRNNDFYLDNIVLAKKK